jgi:hypothetical protein
MARRAHHWRRRHAGAASDVFVNDFVFRLVANIRNLCTRGAAGREFDLLRCKATLTELKVTLHSVPLSLNSPGHLRT